MKQIELLTKEAAAKLLGISVSTFDRWRKSFGLEPERRIKKIPVLFSPVKIKALANMSGNGPENARAGVADRGRLLTLPEIKARAKGGKR